MNFAAFQVLREDLLRERHDVVDGAETNLYRALARLIPPAYAPARATVHRCHLASEWAECFGFSPDTARRAFVSSGVRDSLARLFRRYARRAATLWLPSDSYPVYGELARAARMTTREFPTMPEPVWPDAAPTAAPELLLLTNPLKPLGRFITADDLRALKTWLAGHAARRVMLDAVYTFQTAFHAATLDLLATGQCILLHSLTKGWLEPRLFGVALVPEADAEAVAPVFRAQAPAPESLDRARRLMGAHAGMPAAVADELHAAEERLREAVSGAVTLPRRSAAGYFLMVPIGWKDLLSDRNILGLPGTVFGSTREDITILSTLAFCS